MITARDSGTGGEATRVYIDKHFERLFDGIEFTSTKEIYCKKHEIDIMIDDSATLYTSLENTRTLPIMFGNYPWNKMDNITRIDSWEEATAWHTDWNESCIIPDEV